MPHSERSERTHMNTNVNEKLNSKKGMLHWQMVTVFLMIYDAVAVTTAYFLALLLRFDFRFSMIPAVYFRPWFYFAPIYAFACIAVFAYLKLYRSIWRFASYTELSRTIVASVITTIIQVVGVTIVLNRYVAATGHLSMVDRMPISYYIIGALLQFILITAVRFSYRFVLLLRSTKKKENIKRCAFVGAGAAGRALAADLRKTKAVEEQAICFFDDNKNKWGREIDGIPVVGAKCILGTT